MSTTAPITDLEVVDTFYRDLLSSAGTVTRERVFEVLSDEYVSVPTPPGGPGPDGVFATLQFFAQVVPDLRWTPQEIIEHGGRFIIRSTATGTPVAPFFGVDPATGRSFEIMSIDIFTVRDGRIVHGYHLEDWTTAIAQLTADD